MIEELRRFIIEEYISQNREIDDDFYIGIVEIFCKHEELEDYIHTLKLGEAELIEGADGLYYPPDKELTIDMDLVEEHSSDIMALLGDNLSEKEKIWFKYVFAARTVLHELTHVKQEKNRNEMSLQDAENTSEIILARLDPYHLENILHMVRAMGKENTEKSLNEWFYHLDEEYECDIMSERDAEIQSCLLISTILSSSKEEIPHLMEYLKAVLHSSVGMGYKYQNDRIASPAEQYAEYLRKRNMIPESNCKWYDKDETKSVEKSIKKIPSKLDRFKFGLPVTPEEYLEFKRKLSEYEQNGYIVATYGSEDRSDDTENRS